MHPVADVVVFLVVLAVGGLLLAGAVAVDVRRERRRREVLAEPPPRNHPAVDDVAPSYVTQDDIDRMPAPAGTGRAPARTGIELPGGHAHPDFATHGNWAVLGHPVVVVVEDEVSSMRELLVPLRLRGDRPLVVACGGAHDVVLTTLAANRRALGTEVVLAVLDQVDLLELAGIAGCDVLGSSDLKAGYLPGSALGSLEQWASTPDVVRVIPSISSET